jgi:RNA polymerase sigma factor (sigma-70 family)
MKHDFSMNPHDHVGLLDTIARQIGTGVLERHELVSEGYFGLLDGMSRVDLERTCKPSYYLGYYIRKQMYVGIARAYLVRNKNQGLGAEKRRAAENMVRLDSYGSQSDEDNYNKVPCKKFLTPDSATEKRERREQILKAIRSLTPIERDIVYSSYYCRETYQSIADRIGKTRQRVEQIHAKALTRLAFKLRPIIA